MHLPRTGATYSPHTKAGTSDWAGEATIRAQACQPGDIWLGPYFHPSPEAQEASEAIFALDVALRGMEMPDLDHEQWREGALSTCRQHIEALARTATTEIGVQDDRHLITIGGTRGGKGTTAIIPNLCLYEGSIVCIDPKGENARITAARRGTGSDHAKGMGQTVIVLDPYRESRLDEDRYSSWNPLDLIDPAADDVIDRAAGIADALVIKTSEENAHFDESARILIKALILYVASEYQGRLDRNLITVYDLLINGARAQLQADQASDSPTASKGRRDPFTYLLFLMNEKTHFASDVIAGAANMIRAMGDRERGSVLATARRNLEFLERPAIQRVLAHSSFDLDTLKTDPAGVTIFLCLPPQRMHDTSRFLRLMITACLERMYEIDAQPATGKPVLFILDEFASLRHLAVIEHAAGYSAGFGIKLWLILQDITQLKRHYHEGWETFLGNAGVVQAFANSDSSTLDYLSKKIGQTEVVQQIRNETTQSSVSVTDPSTLQRVNLLASWRMFLSTLSMQTTGQSASNSVTYQQQIRLTPLIQPEEIEACFAREEQSQLVLIKGQSNRPMILDRQAYFEDWRFLGLYHPDRTVHWADRAEALVEAERREADWRGKSTVAISAARDWIAELEKNIAELKSRST